MSTNCVGTYEQYKERLLKMKPNVYLHGKKLDQVTPPPQTIHVLPTIEEMEKKERQAASHPWMEPIVYSG